MTDFGPGMEEEYWRGMWFLGDAGWYYLRIRAGRQIWEQVTRE
jgi:hypothetical protein